MPWHLGAEPLTIPTLVALAQANGPGLAMASGLHERLSAMHDSLWTHAQNGYPIYGFNTGFGGNALSLLSEQAASGLQSRLASYLDCGTGPHLGEGQSRAALAARLQVLSLNHSAISPNTFANLLAIFNAGGAPLIPRYGSLGASGDLVTLAPLARLVSGDEVPCWHQGQLVSGLTFLQDHGIAARPLTGRDGLAIMNGLSVAAALMALEIHHSQQLLTWSLHSIAATVAALGAFPSAFSPAVNSAPVRHHHGQALVAQSIARLIADLPHQRLGEQRAIQDEYSLRCVPQTLGPIYDLFALYTQWVEAELNSASDNPVFHNDAPPQSGGNFFGGYLVMAADGLAQCLARLADLLERQTFLLVDGRHGLPANLCHNTTAEPYRHGVKGVHQLASSLAMDCQRLAVPAAIFSRSAEIHNQDIVSNAMNAAMRVSELRFVASQLIAAHTLIAAQALQMAGFEQSQGPLAAWHNLVREQVPLVTDDRPLRESLERLTKIVQTESLNFDVR